MLQDKLIVLLIIVLGQLIIGYNQNIRTNDLEKLREYECGFESIGNSRMKYDIIYYIIGILYLIFDLEVILLYPILYVLRSYLSLFILFFFVTILIAGYIYEWKIGALNIVYLKKFKACSVTQLERSVAS